MAEKTTQENTNKERPPIVAVMGHIDHGKSTLLDYIRNTNAEDLESGGITQHISAYEVQHKGQNGEEKKITFLDTPGHEAFSAMRARGAMLADIVVLIISAEDGIKAQTLEAYEEIKSAKTPFLIAINKIDKPNANPEKIKNELTEKGIYLEGYGGDIPYVAISSKTGDGVPELLDMLLLIAELSELKADPSNNAAGVVVESNIDPKKGISATLVITDGTLREGVCVSAGGALSPVRAIENFSGKRVPEATFSSPVRITGFDSVPMAGDKFTAFNTKKEAEKCMSASKTLVREKNIIGSGKASVMIPVVIKTDVLGTLAAIEKELLKTVSDKVALKIIHSGAGEVTENDIKVASGSPDTIIIGFRVSIDSKAADAAEKLGIPVRTFAVIYTITDFMEKEVMERTPKEEVEEQTGKAKVLRIFSRTKDKQVLGGAVNSGNVSVGAKVNIIRRDANIGTGKILELQQQKVGVNEVGENTEFGAMIESRTEIAEGDSIVPFVIVTK